MEMEMNGRSTDQETSELPAGRWRTQRGNHVVHAAAPLAALALLLGAACTSENVAVAEPRGRIPSEGANMGERQLTQLPITRTAMLIRRPVAEVFEAFIDPQVTTGFWFTKSSGRLEAGTQVQWEWEMYGVSIPVTARIVEPHRRIVIEWPGYGSPTTVEWAFRPLEDGTTFVSITNAGFTGDGDALVKQATDSVQGFSLVLAGLKALLEHDVRLNLVADRYPKGIDDH